MTGHFSKVYEETYKDQSIEIYCFSPSTPGGVGSSQFYAVHYGIIERTPPKSCDSRWGFLC
jgi:hypothetical protein